MGDEADFALHKEICDIELALRLSKQIVPSLSFLSRHFYVCVYHCKDVHCLSFITYVLHTS